jgi:ribosomal protein RSM22 (predicted rRNA methylase)
VQLPESVRRKFEERVEPVGFPALKRASAEISQAYREGRTPTLGTLQRVAAYLITRMPATFAAVDAVLREVRERLGGAKVESVLDVGAGSGAASLAAQRWFSESRLTLIEQDAVMADAAREILPGAAIRMEDFTRLERFPPHDLVIAAYALGEARRPEVVARLWAAARVALVVIEPGTPRGFAWIRDIRSLLLASGAHMVAPCPGAVPCPLVEPDWCHFAARVERTSLHRRLKQAELNYEDEKFSYVAVARESATPAASRIIRRPRHAPGLVVLETCTPRGVETVRATQRDRGRFRAARRSAWGDPFPPAL